MRGSVSFEKLWQDLVEQQFPKTNQSHIAVALGDMKRYTEEKVDTMRQQKDEELEQYKKEIERSKRIDNSKIAGGQDGQKIVVKKKKVIANGSVKRTAAANI